MINDCVKIQSRVACDGAREVNAWMDAARGFPRGPVDALGKNPFFLHDADAGFCRNQPRLLAEFMARWRGGWLLGTSAQIKRIVPGLRPLP